ncbi:hypothetical protein [Citricoccus muralis]|uniref:Superfamily III holin-X n=1 Tax=Citricoccus muralis TaxID=169134 RepID=A0ABY8H870_9MICC|nr:hypothetical protein [Citricoccus muralis]WFP17340.1 hypothetical protein P8192_04300 [Citricoccus muralis]
MQSVESASSSSPASRAAAGLGSKITFAVMITVLLVAIVFAANQNHIIGWLVVAISAGWLILATAVVLFVRRGARAVNNQVKNAQATFAAQQNAQRADTASAQPAGDPMRDSKLDHSFKIVEVQTRVVNEELRKGAEADQQMIERALETIAMTSSNARDMINPDRAQQRNNDSEPPISGDVIN